MDIVRVAACQYGVESLETWKHYEQKLTRLVKEAAVQRAQLLVFPEYGAMELTSLFPRSMASLPHQLEALQEHLEPYLELHRALARQYELYILAASFPVRLHEGAYHNRAYFIAPTGGFEFQDKRIMTRFEREIWGIDAGDTLKVFETSLGRMGIAICYDAEFPMQVRAQVEAGAEIILVPSCTDTEAGYHRVRIAAQARALENQCYVVQACIVGDAEWSQAIDHNVGAAGVYTPPNSGLPSDGVSAIGPRDQPFWLYATLDLAKLREVRRDGQTLNHADWSKQLSTKLTVVDMVDL